MKSIFIQSKTTKLKSITLRLPQKQRRMKIRAIILAGLLLLIYSVSAQTKEFKRYSMKSGIVKYEISGMQNGTAEMYFDDFGMKEATYEKAVIEMYGIKQQSESVNYLQGYWQYNIDKLTNSATKTKNTILESIVENSEDGDLVVIGKEMFISMGGKLIGEEDVIGKLCEIWELESLGTKVWVWENIPLRTETNMMGISIIRIATSVEENADVAASKLEIPTDIEFKEIDLGEVQKMMDGY